jgi:hypothetical protein
LARLIIGRVGRFEDAPLQIKGGARLRQAGLQNKKKKQNQTP